jgi:hypothetical protein
MQNYHISSTSLMNFNVCKQIGTRFRKSQQIEVDSKRHGEASETRQWSRATSAWWSIVRDTGQGSAWSQHPAKYLPKGNHLEIAGLF